ncbi:MAG: add [Mucilaginibacter sp.]|nr:add [Mucilaginibacter sp.]
MYTQEIINDFIIRIPKAELHMHLEGSIEPKMMFKLAERNKIKLRWESPEALREAYHFNNLQSFLDLLFEGCNVLRTEQDFYDVTEAYLNRVKLDGVRHAEAFIGPQSFLQNGVPIDVVMNGVIQALKDAEKTTGITTGFLISAHRHRTEAAAFELLELIMPWRDQLVGLGMGGAEVGNPPSKFQQYFKECHARGFNLTIHAGEEGPTEYVREAINLLGVDRIDHGNTAMRDPELLQQLSDKQIALTMCPVSNLLLNVITDLSEHPLRIMLQKNIPVTINSDDPSYFNAYVAENWIQSQMKLSLTFEEMIQLAKNSFQGSFLPLPRKAQYITEIENFCLDFFRRDIRAN